MSQQKATIATRFRRLGRLACWLWRTGRDLNSLNGSNSEERNRVLVKLGKGALEALDIELEAGIQPEHGDSCGTLVVANHVSWLDIFAISSVYPCSFIAKQEIGSWPVLGRMGKNAGTVFINRNSRRDIEPINQAICEALKAGENVSFFPEARTSSGLDVLPFKAALFQSAMDADAPIQVLALRYYDGDGRRSPIPSYADVSLPTSLWRIVSMKKIRITLDFAPLFKTAEFPDKDRYGLKDVAEAFVRKKVAEDI